MSLARVLDTIRRQWWLVLLTVIVGLVSAAAVTHSQTEVYRDSVSLYVGARAGSSDIGALLNEGTLAQQRVASYVAVASSTPLGEAVKQDTGLDESAESIVSRVSASSRPGTVVIDVSVNDTSPTRAHEIAESIGRVFGDVVRDLEADTGNRSLVNVSVLKLEPVPAAPYTPRPAVNLILGGLAGLLVGLLLVVGIQQLDRRFGPQDDIEELVGGPLLARIPQSKGDVFEEAAPLSRSPRGESLRTARTNLRFVGVDRAMSSVVITSARPSEGKSSTALGLARVLAEGGSRVLLVDADLRQPMIDSMLGLDSAVGLTDYLLGHVELDDAVQKSPVGDLSILTAGRLPPNPSELLSSIGMAAFVDRVVAEYDVTIFDAPPVLPFTDAAVLGAQCGGAILVARFRKVNRDDVRSAAETLRQAGVRVLGAIANAVPVGREDAYGYGYERQQEAAGRRRVSLRGNTGSPGKRRRAESS